MGWNNFLHHFPFLYVSFSCVDKSWNNRFQWVVSQDNFSLLFLYILGDPEQVVGLLLWYENLFLIDLWKWAIIISFSCHYSLSPIILVIIVLIKIILWLVHILILKFLFQSEWLKINSYEWLSNQDMLFTTAKAFRC